MSRSWKQYSFAQLKSLGPAVGIVISNIKTGRKKESLKSQLDIENRPNCPSCAVKQVSYYWNEKTKDYYFRKYCAVCADVHYKRGRQLSKAAEKMIPCKECSFMPTDPCQMDWDHIDGNHTNNAPENLQLLCSNCHRLKTKENKDSGNLKYKVLMKGIQLVAAS